MENEILLMNEEEKENCLEYKINLMFPSEQEKVSAIMTFMGICGELTFFLKKKEEEQQLNDFPEEILYAMAISAANILALQNEENIEDLESWTFPIEEYESEKAYAQITHKKLVKVVNYLHEIIRDDGQQAE